MSRGSRYLHRHQPYDGSAFHGRCGGWQHPASRTASNSGQIQTLELDVNGRYSSELTDDVFVGFRTSQPLERVFTPGQQTEDTKPITGQIEFSFEDDVELNLSANPVVGDDGSDRVDLRYLSTAGDT